MAAELPIISGERLTVHELCPRRRKWTEEYENLRVSLVKALYISLDAGLTAEENPEKAAQTQFLDLARSPGLDIVGEGTYATAYHHAKLAGILALALRSSWMDPWKPVDPLPLPRGRTWHSALYDAGDGHYRRVALVDRWTDDRRTQETWSWRTVGEVCVLNHPILMNALTIGPMHDKRRHSHWTRCYLQPRNNAIRFKRKTSKEGFAGSWRQEWRENVDVSSEQWLTRMREDGCMVDLVHTVRVVVPENRQAYLDQMMMLSREMSKSGDVPPMRLAGCFGFSPCNFRTVCHGGTVPENHGFRKRA